MDRNCNHPGDSKFSLSRQLGESISEKKSINKSAIQAKEHLQLLSCGKCGSNQINMSVYLHEMGVLAFKCQLGKFQRCYFCVKCLEVRLNGIFEFVFRLLELPQLLTA